MLLPVRVIRSFQTLPHNKPAWFLQLRFILWQPESDFFGLPVKYYQVALVSVRVDDFAGGNILGSGQPPRPVRISTLYVDGTVAAVAVVVFFLYSPVHPHATLSLVSIPRIATVNVSLYGKHLICWAFRTSLMSRSGSLSRPHPSSEASVCSNLQEYEVIVAIPKRCWYA